MFKNITFSKYNLLVWLPIHLISITYIFYFGLSIADLTIVLFFSFIWGCLGIEIGYHRYFSHRSFKTHNVIEKILLFLGIWGAQDSVIWWKSLHINHHLNSDTEKDIHSPVHGKLHAYFLWIWKHHSVRIFFNKRMLKSNLYKFTHRYYVLIYWFPILLLSFFSLKYAILIFIIPGFICINQVNIVNLFSHWPTSKQTWPNNNVLVGLLSWGLGFHKIHHDDQTKYDFHYLDISGKIINLIKS